MKGATSQKGVASPLPTLTGRLVRGESTEEGTFGHLVIDAPSVPEAPFSCRTVELPWRGNQNDISCIPSGRYRCVFNHSKRFDKDLYLIQDVPGRAGVRIHVMNHAGDEAKGWVSESDGCIGVGRALTAFKPKHGDRVQKAVSYSWDTLDDLHLFTRGMDMDLSIEWAEGVDPEGVQV
ncbi:hypothetical protein KQI63_09700 [bacterium]|nr:hypothetical protein [bacterium]